MANSTVSRLCRRALVSILLCTVSCKSPVAATQILIVVDAEDAVRARMSTLQLRTQGSRGADIAEPQELNVSGEELTFPLRFTVVPERNDAARTLTVRIAGADDSGEFVVSNVLTSFLAQRTLALRITLTELCIDSTCEVEGLTCNEDGTCVDREIDMLPEADAGVDAGVDAPVDSGTVDSADADTSTCPIDQELCDGVCISPLTDRNYCGAVACVGGVVCEEGEVCRDGLCDASCGGVLIECEGECTDPRISLSHCGASGDCEGPRAGSSCTATEFCREGVCRSTICTVNADCDDGVGCNGAETCEPDAPTANRFGCVSGAPVPDMDEDGEDGVACGGNDCDDTQPGFLLGDWAHCSECGDVCGERSACEAGSCTAARRVFVTSTRYNGNLEPMDPDEILESIEDLSGVERGDAICQLRAEAAALGGEWKSYLWTSAEGVDRLLEADAPFIRLDGVRVADNWTDLTDRSLAEPLFVTEQRTRPGRRPPNTWTGRAGSNCLDWTSAEDGCGAGGPCGTMGQASQVDGRWDGFSATFFCQSTFHLYCIEQ